MLALCVEVPHDSKQVIAEPTLSQKSFPSQRCLTKLHLGTQKMGRPVNLDNYFVFWQVKVNFKDT